MSKRRMPQMGGNMNNMMKQVQKMQKEMMEAQSKIEEQVVEGSSGGGVVTVEANGKREIISIKIDQDVIDPDDKEMLEDLVMAAVNDALRRAEDIAAKEMGRFTGGLNIPGL